MNMWDTYDEIYSKGYSEGYAQGFEDAQTIHMSDSDSAYMRGYAQGIMHANAGTGQ